MTDSTPADAAAALRDAVSLWRLTPATAVEEVIDAATDCLVAGLDSPSLRELAGASPFESRFVLDPLIEDTVDELGMSEILETNVRSAALGAMLRRLDNDRVSPRQLAAWAHEHIGHEGPDECEPFVVLDDMYDEAMYLAFDESTLDEWTREEAAAFLKGAPSPGLTLNWPILPVQDRSRNPLSRLRSLLRRS